MVVVRKSLSMYSIVSAKNDSEKIMIVLLFQRSFDIVCKVGLVHMGGQGASKKEAKRKAASDILEHLTEAGSGAHALVFGKDGKEGQEEVNLRKAIQDLSLDVQATKLQDLQRTSLKSRYVYTGADNQPELSHLNSQKTGFFWIGFWIAVHFGGSDCQSGYFSI